MKEIKPAVVAGLSLGEYSALVAGGMLDFKDAVRLVRKRGQYMEEAVPSGVGGMSAVLGLDKEEVKAAFKPLRKALQSLNFNCRTNSYRGEVEALKIAEEKLKAAGAKGFCLFLLAVLSTLRCFCRQPRN